MESKTSITIDYTRKGRRMKRHVVAQVVGPLAFHHTVGETGFWTVTHVVTGRSLYRFIVRETDARLVTEQLQSLDWDHTEDELIASLSHQQAVASALLSVGITVNVRQDR